MIRRVLIVAAIAAICLHFYYQEDTSIPVRLVPVISPDDEPHSSLQVSAVTIPNILYAGEKRSVSINISNMTDRTLDCVVTLELGDTVTEKVSVPSGNNEPIVFGFQCPSREKLPLQCSIKVQADESYTQHFLLVDGRGDLSQIQTNGITFRTINGIRTVLVNDYENETSYRRWAPVKWAVASYGKQGAKRLLWIPSEITGSPEIDGITQIPHCGNPFEAMLKAMEHIPGQGTSIMAIGWGFEEAYKRMLVEDCVRAMDLVVDRSRQKNPATQFLLLTPPPIIGEEKMTGRYARALLTLGREHHVPVIDIHKAVLAVPGWESFYSLVDDPAVSQLYPSSKGQALIRKLITEGLQ